MPPLAATAHTSRGSVPCGWLRGLVGDPGDKLPRAYTMVSASGLHTRSPIPWPSSPVYDVRARAAYAPPAEGSASHTLRLPRVLNTHASRPFAGAAVSSVGNGAPRTCSTVNGRL